MREPILVLNWLNSRVYWQIPVHDDGLFIISALLEYFAREKNLLRFDSHALTGKDMLKYLAIKNRRNNNLAKDVANPIYFRDPD